jgi:serine/threonine-protein kinase
MPYVEGESLRERLSRTTQLPIDEALGVAREVADALAYAHGQGIIHRDIKPENILLSGPHALVADFGIARAVGEAGGERLTETGMAVGTVAYMSPEQATGTRRLDGRSDIYSLGCVLYEMLAGEPPYTGPTPQAVMARRLTEVPRPLRSTRETTPAAVEHTVSRMLARSPADRFATAHEVARALEASLRAPPSTSPASTRGPILVVTMSLLVLGILLAARAVTRVTPEKTADATRQSPRLVVLPFENLGDSSTLYFADGITEEVRGKLAKLPGLQVIASTSSNQYRGRSTAVEQIVRELGAQYVLTATVRWDAEAGGPGRVRVTPELVRATEGGPPTTEWQQAFAAELTDVFQVQADIATQVAQALDLKLGSGERAGLAERPTENLEAYQAYLRGNSVSRSLAEDDPPSLRRAIRHYERAIALDSTFAPAWARLAETQALLYINFPGSDIGAVTRAAAERAVALAPDLPEARRAMGIYFITVPKDPRRAAEQTALGLKLAPNDPELLTSAAQIDWALGRWHTAVARLQHAASLDPRAEKTAQTLGQGYLWLRQYPQAREALERTRSHNPDNPITLQLRAMVELARGDLAAARAVLHAAPPEVEEALAVSMAVYWDVGWALPEETQRTLLGATPEVFGVDRIGWAMVHAQLLWIKGDTALARAYADSAQAVTSEALHAVPDDAQLRAMRGVALATLGRRDEAVELGRRAVALLPVSKDAYYGPYIQLQLARIHTLLDNQDAALDQLEPLLRIPYYLSPGWLRVDPTFGPLRGNPRFQRLVRDTGP